MDKNVDLMLNKKLEVLKSKLEDKGYICTIAETKEEVCQVVKSSIEDGASVSLGGSQTVKEVGVEKLLCEMNINFIDKDCHNLPEKERNELRRQAFTSDYYFTGTNAIDMDGVLYNIDGLGNRVAAMCFGPKKVFIIIGTNKIVNNEQEAWSRIRNVASVANCYKHNSNTPCVKVGKCCDCNSEDRICNQFVKIVRSRDKNRTHIIFIKGDWGF